MTVDTTMTSPGYGQLGDRPLGVVQLSGPRTILVFAELVFRMMRLSSTMLLTLRDLVLIVTLITVCRLWGLTRVLPLASITRSWMLATVHFIRLSRAEILGVQVFRMSAMAKATPVFAWVASDSGSATIQWLLVIRADCRASSALEATGLSAGSFRVAKKLGLTLVKLTFVSNRLVVMDICLGRLVMNLYASVLLVGVTMSGRGSAIACRVMPAGIMARPEWNTLIAVLERVQTVILMAIAVFGLMVVGTAIGISMAVWCAFGVIWIPWIILSTTDLLTVGPIVIWRRVVPCIG